MFDSTNQSMNCCCDLSLKEFIKSHKLYDMMKLNCDMLMCFDGWRGGTTHLYSECN